MSDNVESIKKGVKEYYGETLSSSNDLKTSACCPIDAMPKHIRPLIGNIHEEVISKFYGCGSPIPYALEGKTVLDLGCGTGRDCYIASQLVGKEGNVIGVDMTENQLEVAKRHVDYHMLKFGYKKPNVEFKLSHIENLQEAGIKDESVDVVISNCVINLSPDKQAVFEEIFRVLKPGGELYFSDIFTDRRIPEKLQYDKVLVGECLGGAMYIEDFRRMLDTIGCPDFRVIESGKITLDDSDIEKKAGMIGFYSKTIRAFKCDLEDRCEDFGHVAYYKGTIIECPHSFILDDHHEFKTGQPVLVCGNTANMLKQTRFSRHFRVDGDFSTHYGLFDCAPEAANSSDKENSGACC